MTKISHIVDVGQSFTASIAFTEFGLYTRLDWSLAFEYDPHTNDVKPQNRGGNIIANNIAQQGRRTVDLIFENTSKYRAELDMAIIDLANNQLVTGRVLLNRTPANSQVQFCEFVKQFSPAQPYLPLCYITVFRSK